MKPSSKDIKYKILITGQELIELKKLIWEMVEAFGLNHKIEKYQGKRPIGFYRWDLDCLEDLISMAVENTEEYPDELAIGYKAINTLYERIKELKKEAYDD